MPSRICGESLGLSGPVSDPKKVVRGQVARTSIIPEVKAKDDIRQPERDENMKSALEQLTALLKSTGKKFDPRLSRSSWRVE